MKIRSRIIPIFFFSILISCSSDEPNPVSMSWEKVMISDEVAVYGIYGNIDETILVGTADKILRSQDKGKTWNKVLQSDYAVSEFRKVGNIILALTNFTDYYSNNNGESWQILDANILPSDDFSLKTSTGVLYKLEFHSNGELSNPTSVLRSCDKGDHWDDVFPYQHGLYSTYIDDKDRVYLGTNDWAWDEQAGSFVSGNENVAVLYYSK